MTKEKMIEIDFSELLKFDHSSCIKFNNNITKRYIRHIVKNECILFIRVDNAKDAIRINNKIKSYNIEGALSRVSIWCTSETDKQFQNRVLKNLKK